MKNLHRLLLVGAICAGSASVALADVPAVSFVYSGSSRMDGAAKPLAKFKVYANVEKGRVRKLVKYVVDFSSMPKPASQPHTIPMPAFGGYHAGSLGYVIDRDNDKFIAYSSELNSYVEQPRMALLKQLRFDPFSKVAPQLSKEAPPELTPEQRQRLGQEISVVAHQFLKNNMRVYFRALPGTRKFKALGDTATHGYRMEILFNASGPGQPAHWGKVSSEWWIADNMPGDDMIRAITAGLFSDWKSVGGISTSMWINESLPVLWEAMPQAFRSAIGTFMPLPPSEKAWYGGTLAYLTVTTDTRNLKSHHPGVFRTEINLQNRNTAALRDDIFLAPPQYKKQDIGFLLVGYKMLSASLLSPNGPLADIMKNKMPMKMPMAGLFHRNQ